MVFSLIKKKKSRSEAGGTGGRTGGKDWSGKGKRSVPFEYKPGGKKKCSASAGERNVTDSNSYRGEILRPSGADAEIFWKRAGKPGTAKALKGLPSR